MAALDPEYMTPDYRCQYRGVPRLDHDPSDFPMDWTVLIDAPVWAEGARDAFEDEGRVRVGRAHLSFGPDAGLIDLFDTLDAVDQILANVGAALRRYWSDYGFREAACDYLVLGDMADAFDA